MEASYEDFSQHTDLSNIDFKGQIMKKVQMVCAMEQNQLKKKVSNRKFSFIRWKNSRSRRAMSFLR